MPVLGLGLDSDTSWRRQPEQREITLEQFSGLGLTYPSVASGVSVGPQNAMTYSAFWNAVDIISSQVALLPRVLYRRVDDDDRERATTHHAYKILVGDPNVNCIPFVFWQTLMSHVLTWGNGFAEIEFDRASRPIALHNIPPDAVNLRVENNVLWYEHKGKRIEKENVLHVPGLGYDGYCGYSVVTMARQSIGVGLAEERFAGTFYGNNAVPGLILEHPGRLTPEAQNRLRVSWQREHGGGRQGGVAVVEEGMKVSPLGIPQKDAQFLESREFGVVEMARWFNLPPHKLKHKVGERPGGNLESSQIEFLTDTLAPWLARIEQECNRKLIAPGQRGTFYVEHLADATLRLDARTRVDVQKSYFEMGVLDAEQIAKQQNLPKPKPKPEPAPAAPPQEPPLEDDARMSQARRSVFLDAAARFVRRETGALKRALKQGPDGFEARVAELYGHEEAVLVGLLEPSVRLSLAASGSGRDAGQVARELARLYVERSRDALGSLPAKGLALEGEMLMERWLAHRPVELADAMASAGGDHVGG